MNFNSETYTYRPEIITGVNIGEKWIPITEVEYIDIAEDWLGRDLVTFKYKGKTYHSFVTTREQ